MLQLFMQVSVKPASENKSLRKFLQWALRRVGHAGFCLTGHVQPHLLFPCKTFYLGQQETGRMAASKVALGIIFLSQTVFGALGNSLLLLHYLVLYFTGCRVRHTDLILKHLIVANLLTLLCRGVPQTVVAFGVNGFLSDMG